MLLHRGQVGGHMAVPWKQRVPVTAGEGCSRDSYLAGFEILGFGASGFKVKGWGLESQQEPLAFERAPESQDYLDLRIFYDQNSTMT